MSENPWSRNFLSSLFLQFQFYEYISGCFVSWTSKVDLPFSCAELCRLQRFKNYFLLYLMREVISIIFLYHSFKVILFFTNYKRHFSSTKLFPFNSILYIHCLYINKIQSRSYWLLITLKKTEKMLDWLTARPTH